MDRVKHSNFRNRKKILFLSGYFRPELTADTHLDDDLIDCLISAGFDIRVLCPIPTRGVSESIINEYKRKKKELLRNGSLEIIRFWAPQEKKNTIQRAIRYIFCNIRQYQIASRMDDIDIIYCISTPPTQGMLSVLVKKKLNRNYKHKIENIYYLEDVFPDTLIAAGLSHKGSLMWRIGRKIEDYTYANTSKIVTISEECVQNIVNKNVKPSKIQLIENWVDLSETKYIDRNSNKLFADYELEVNKFHIVYAGNLGRAQNIDLILDVAESLLGEEFIRFTIFGSGGEEEAVKERVKNERITNVKILPLQPTDRVSEVYSLGDANLVICKKGFGKSALPSKTWSIMATERPILASFDLDGDLCKIIKHTHSGLCAEPDNKDELVRIIKAVYEMDEAQRRKMGRNGREYVMEKRDKQVCTAEFLKAFNSLDYWGDN